MKNEFEHLYEIAKNLAISIEFSTKFTSGDVACALSTVDRVIYTGVSIRTPCSLGFCAEHSAIASMVKDQIGIIKNIIAVDNKGNVLPPCGRCRQLLLFLHKENVKTKVYINNEGNYLSLSELTPYSKGA